MSQAWMWSSLTLFAIVQVFLKKSYSIKNGAFNIEVSLYRKMRVLLISSDTAISEYLYLNRTMQKFDCNTFNFHFTFSVSEMRNINKINFFQIS